MASDLYCYENFADIIESNNADWAAFLQEYLRTHPNLPGKEQIEKEQIEKPQKNKQTNKRANKQNYEIWPYLPLISGHFYLVVPVHFTSL